MELLDLEEAGFSGAAVERRRQTEASNCGGGGTRCVVLRRYSLTICLLEALVILLFIYLLVSAPPQSGPTASLNPNQDASCQPASSAQNLSARTFTFDDGDNFLLLDLVQGCDQRKHDLPLGIACKSSQTDHCRPVEWLKISKQEDADKEKDPTARRVIIVTTSEAGDRLTRRDVILKQVKCGKAGVLAANCRFKTRLDVHVNKKSNAIIGWGGALTDSSINNILSLTTNGTRRLLDDYFSSFGLRFNMVRITIGGSDFSSRFYTNDDSKSDFQLKDFKLREEDLLYKIPLLKLIQDEYKDVDRTGQGKVKVLASMWSPPTWMKTNNHFNKGQLRGSIDDEPLSKRSSFGEYYYDALSELKVKFLQAYEAESIDFWGLTVMNEPLFAVQPFLNFNTMIFPSKDYANYVAKYLGPKIKNNPQLQHIKLIAHDDNRRYLPNYTWPILDQMRVRQFIDGVSVHGYVDEDYQLLADTHARYKDTHAGSGLDEFHGGFFVLPNELCSGHLPFMAKALVGNWHRGMHYGLDIIRSLQGGAAGWVDWNMALDLEGGPGWLGGRLDAPVIVDKGRDLFYKSPMFYVLGQFSRFIWPGSVKLASDLHNAHYDHHFETVSYASPTGAVNTFLTTVILNNNPYPIEVHLRWLHDGSHWNSNATGQNNDTDQEQDLVYYVVNCPADSIITVVYAKGL